jgi:hypothetical protein
VDSDGNVVSLTTTLNENFEAASSFPKVATFSQRDGRLHDGRRQSEPARVSSTTDANAIEPGKRMASSMTPTIVLRDNKPFLALGIARRTDDPDDRSPGLSQHDRVREVTCRRDRRTAIPSAGFPRRSSTKRAQRRRR